jgi:hypothetical protein
LTAKPADGRWISSTTASCRTARDVNTEVREFADEHIAPNAEGYYDSGE